VCCSSDGFHRREAKRFHGIASIDFESHNPPIGIDSSGLGV
jgi:hypothetical protein